jgi:hypothetical protein
MKKFMKVPYLPEPNAREAIKIVADSLREYSGDKDQKPGKIELHFDEKGNLHFFVPIIEKALPHIHEYEQPGDDLN